MKNYNKNKELSYLQYWDVNNLCTWKMLQKFPVNNFEWIQDTSQFHEDFITNYNEEGDERCFLKVNVQYTQRLIERLHDKNEYLMHIRKLKQALSHRLVLKKFTE